MRFGDAEIPEDLSYTKNHLWVDMKDRPYTLGWTDYIQINAGDVNNIHLPAKGTLLDVNQEFGSVETSKWVDRLYSPLKGRVVEVNKGLLNKPELINNAPFGKGWFITVEPSEKKPSEGVITPEEYCEYLKVCEKGESIDET